MQFARHMMVGLRLQRLPDVWRVRHLQSPKLGDVTNTKCDHAYEMPQAWS